MARPKPSQLNSAFATFLIVKVPGKAEDHAFKLAIRVTLTTLLLMAAVSLATPFLASQASQYWGRRFRMPSFLFVSQVPLLTGTLLWSASVAALGAAAWTIRPWLNG